MIFLYLDNRPSPFAIRHSPFRVRSLDPRSGIEADDILFRSRTQCIERPKRSYFPRYVSETDAALKSITPLLRTILADGPYHGCTDPMWQEVSITRPHPAFNRVDR